MRCAWCSAEATRGVGDRWVTPCCDAAACAEESYQVGRAFMGAAWRLHAGSLDPAMWRASEAAEDAAEERDARELRGEPPSMEGWALW